MAWKSASFGAMSYAFEEQGGMRTTVAIDDDLLETAQRLTGVKEKAAVLREGL
jgi:Arc/MetJ family transcription regulator